MDKPRYPDFRFTLEEFSGAFGDSITVIPLLVGIALITEASLSNLLLFFGIFQIATGFYFRLPMPVEPMKALATLAIAGALSYSGVAAAGIVLGIVLLISGGLGVMRRLDKLVPKSVVRDVQLGLAAKDTDHWPVTILTGVVSFFTNIGVGFIIGFIVAKLLRKRSQ